MCVALGVRNALRGIKVAPKFLCQHVRTSAMFDCVQDATVPLDALSAIPVEQVLSPLHRPCGPLRNAFLEAVG